MVCGVCSMVLVNEEVNILNKAPSPPPGFLFHQLIIGVSIACTFHIAFYL